MMVEKNQQICIKKKNRQIYITLVNQKQIKKFP